MYVKTDDAVQEILHDLRRHPALSFLADIAPAIGELSHEWNATVHFTAREAGTGLQVVIKVGVTEAEMYWTAHLSSVSPDLFPKVFAVIRLQGLPPRASRPRAGRLYRLRENSVHPDRSWLGGEADGYAA